MRLLLDTNVLFAAFVARGACAELLEYVAEHHQVVTSGPLLTELEEALVAKAGASPAQAKAARMALAGQFEIVIPDATVRDVCRDPDDDLVLATAAAGTVDAILTGDRDVLVLHSFRGIALMRPPQFWEFEARRAVD